MDPILLRFIERITVVLIGGMAIYLGYRLFRSVPEQRDSAGKIELPHVSIVLSRVGPGVFFALFGTAAVGLSLISPLQITSSGERADITYAGSNPVPAPSTVNRAARADARALLRRDFAVLNSLLRQISPEERDASIRAVVRVKLALLKPVWGEQSDGFGDLAAFETWASGGEIDQPPSDSPAAVELWRYGEPQP